MAISEAMRRAIDLDIGLAQVCSQMEQRPWGLLFQNTANPQHRDSNSARRIATNDPEAVISEIISFYRERNLPPRVKVNDLTVPQDFAVRLEARGFELQQTIIRIMVWRVSGSPTTVLPPNITIDRANVADLDDFVRVQTEGFGVEDNTWLASVQRYQMAHPQIACYLARVDGVAVAAGSVFKGDEWGFVTDVATVPAYRRRGLATALISRIQAEADGPVLLEVVEDDAQRVYQRAGFQVEGELHHTSCFLPNS